MGFWHWVLLGSLLFYFLLITGVLSYALHVIGRLVDWIEEKRRGRMTDIGHHQETIRCPSCGKTQAAIVQHTHPYWTYVHECGCGCII